MSDPAQPSPNELDPAVVASPAQAGGLLRQAREAQGLHIAALAVSLKVSVRRLEALEAGDIGQLPDVVFARSLASSVCRTLKIDPAPVLAHFPGVKASPFKAEDTGLNATFRDGGTSAHGAVTSFLATPLGIGVILVLLGIAGVLLWPKVTANDPLAQSSQSQDVEPQDPGIGAGMAQQASEPAGAALRPAASAASPTASEAALPAFAASVSAAALQVPSVRPAAADDPASVPQATSAASAAGVAGLRPGASAVLGAATGPAGTPALLELDVQAECWTEVLDSAGAVVLRRLLLPGEALRLTGALPLSVKIGRADAVRVRVRGQTLDLSTVARENVARFEVK